MVSQNSVKLSGSYLSSLYILKKLAGIDSLSEMFDEYDRQQLLDSRGWRRKEQQQ
jgi:hypothetical protein